MTSGTLDFYEGRRVLVTGDTGFKGSWLARWLLECGAVVAGLGLEPEESGLFRALRLGARIDHHSLDVRDPVALLGAVRKASPEIVFHLAAESLVHRARGDPQATFATNVMGGANLLEAVARTPSVQAVVFVTSDKVYRRPPSPVALREDDALGGTEPYSASKAAAEHVLEAWAADPRVLARCAAVRAGNVIGGGDVAERRLVPDCVRAWRESKPVVVHSPLATRPWQHVLEPLLAYLLLGAALARRQLPTGTVLNIGPGPSSGHTVGALVQHLSAAWPGSRVVQGELSGGRHDWLALDVSRAKALLGWETRLDLEQTALWTVDWYLEQARGEDMDARTEAQIRAYTSLL